MEKKNKKIWIIGGLVLCLIAVIGITFAFFSTGGTQEMANTFTSGCLNIELTDASASIKLTNAYPISDVEGLNSTSYDFTVRNTCDTPTNYSINLESLNQVANSLNADYIKVSLSSDTFDNVISKLSANTKATPEIDGAYEAYNLYTASLGANETKTYHLKLWIDYDATVEQAANKTYTSKINVVANPEIQVADTLEVKNYISETMFESLLIGDVTSVKYCISADNMCEPTIDFNFMTEGGQNFTYGYLNQLIETKQVKTALGLINVYDFPEDSKGVIMCTRLNESSKVMCTSQKGIKIPDFNVSSCPDKCAGIYKSEDENGVSYYYRGDVKNNYVYFAGYYWRIIRINGDGSIRLIYDGTTIHENDDSSEDRQIGTSTFNLSIYDSTSLIDNAYIGYMYGISNSDNYLNTHANINNSVIKEVIDNWYQTNIESKGYSQYINIEAGFCNDRKLASIDEIKNLYGIELNTNLGYGTNDTLYATSIRLPINNNNNLWKPNLKCNQPENDLFTITNSNIGNKRLTYPVGLITADEVLLVGAIGNKYHYLYTGQDYWTMTPFQNGLLYGVHEGQSLATFVVNMSAGVRPVINLRSDIQITGSGTTSDPFKVVGAS